MTIDIAGAIGQQNYESLRSLVKQTFPDRRCDVSDDLLNKVICALPPEAQRALTGVEVAFDLIHDLAGEIYKSDPEVTGYYVVSAKHERLTGPAQHTFVGSYAWARVRLPQTGQRDINTAVGIAFAGDRATYTVEQVRQKYQAHLDFAIDRVELITPGRYFGALFSALKIYAIYSPQDAVEAWVAESGFATGQFASQYLAPKRDAVIHRPAWYQPTPSPLSEEKDWFTGRATWVDVDELSDVTIEVSRTADAPPHFRTTATFERIAHPDPAFPAKLTAQAAMRVAAIMDAMGKADALMKILAPFGRALPWVKEPE